MISNNLMQDKEEVAFVREFQNYLNAGPGGRMDTGSGILQKEKIKESSEDTIVQMQDKEIKTDLQAEEEKGKKKKRKKDKAGGETGEEIITADSAAAAAEEVKFAEDDNEDGI